MLAALASTIDTHLTWGASYWSNDLYLRLINRAWLKREPSRREQVIVARLSTIVILFIALVIMTNLGSIQTAWYITLLFGAGIGAVLILRWVWERINIFSEITAIAVSLVCAPLILFSVEAEWLRLLLMSSLSTLAVITVTLVTRPTDETTLIGFYTRVQPPGFWSTTAHKAGMESAVPFTKLKSGMFLTVTASVSIYFLLVGIGKLLFPTSGTSPAYSWMYLILGVVSIPLWWRRWSQP
jgi:Na+/proline symporter